MSSFWEMIRGHTWRPNAEPSVPPEKTEEEQRAHNRMWVPRHLEGARSLVFARLQRLVLRNSRRNKRPRRPRLVRLREAVQLGALQMLAPAKDTQAEAAEIYARANVERAELTESYTYEQEISRNPSKTTREMPTGHIRLEIPYDGHKYFTRQACADVVNTARGGCINRDTEVVIGYLLLADYGNTDLDRLLNLSDSYGAVPIRVPVVTNGSTSGLDQIAADRQTCVITYDYAPRSRRSSLHPIDVQIELLDPDSLGILPLDLLTEEGHTKINDIVTSMTQQVTFRPYLWLRITVSLHLPCKSENTNLFPKITKMSLDWPTITSLDALSLTVNGDDVPLRYNPMTRSIEWSDISMLSANDPDEDSDIQLYRNPEMLLVIRQPGELYQQLSLDGQVEVEVPGYLMSGLDSRLYSATGSLSRSRKPELKCRISARIHLILDDAFAKRTFSPWQQLYFDEIVPEEARITDIVTALQDRGFVVEPQTLSDRPERFLVARRREGPDYMFMWLLIERRGYQTKRENKVPGGHTYKSVFESGELRVFIRGTLPRDSCELTHEMNALQQTLRERFDRVRARR